MLTRTWDLRSSSLLSVGLYEAHRTLKAFSFDLSFAPSGICLYPAWTEARMLPKWDSFDTDVGFPECRVPYTT